MPSPRPLKIKVSPEDKYFIYQTLKKVSTILIGDGKSTLKARKDVIRLALKFPPGRGEIVYLQDWERQVIVGWVFKLHNLAQARNEITLRDRFRKIIEILK